MNLPNTILIGVQKSGTTSLYRWLAEHPDVYGPQGMKDFPFFCRDKSYNRGLQWFSQFFDSHKGEKIILHGSVQYMYFSSIVAPRIYSYDRNVKLIAVLRNPADRAYSAYWEARNKMVENIQSFEKAVEAEKKRLMQALPLAARELSYIGHGFYYRQLMHFYNFFNREQIFIALFDDLKNKPHDLLMKIYEFLEIDNHFIPLLALHNPAKTPRSKILQGFLTKMPAPLPHRLKVFLYKKGFHKAYFRDLNSKLFKPPPLDSRIRRKLIDIYRGDILQLQDLLQRDLSSWLMA